jgi:hypothetical protein
MLEFFKRLFGSKTAESAPAPYKVETPAKPAEFPFPSAKPVQAPKAEKKTADKKPVAKKAPAKPRKPKGNI